MKPREYPVFDELDYSDLDTKTHPKLPDLAEDVTRQYARPRADLLTSDATQDQMDDWWLMAQRAHHARGKANSVKLLMDPQYDPLTCECGKLYYNDEDYMCPACREALDASL